MKDPSVLLADDNRPLMMRVAEHLGSSFNVVGTAVNGKDLISLALQLKPDVIVVDITMPVLTGIEAVHQLRNARLKAKFIFLTLHNESEFLKACLEVGAVGYVLKTQIKNDLIPAINAALAGKQFVSSGVSMSDDRD